MFKSYFILLVRLPSDFRRARPLEILLICPQRGATIKAKYQSVWLTNTLTVVPIRGVYFPHGKFELVYSVKELLSCG